MASSHITCSACDGAGGLDGIRCDNCGGHGFFVRCRGCDGGGYVIKAYASPDDYDSSPCKPCRSTGKLYAFGEELAS